MAREEGMTGEPGDQLAWKWPWKDIVSTVASLVGVLGLAFFAVSNSAYGHFYRGGVSGAV
jgi:hypothetical protein